MMHQNIEGTEKALTKQWNEDGRINQIVIQRLALIMDEQKQERLEKQKKEQEAQCEKLRKEIEEKEFLIKEKNLVKEIECSELTEFQWRIVMGSTIVSTPFYCIEEWFTFHYAWSNSLFNGRGPTSFVFCSFCNWFLKFCLLLLVLEYLDLWACAQHTKKNAKKKELEELRKKKSV